MRSLITGGSSGIGAAFARAFAFRGVDLVLIARDEQRLDSFAEQLRSEYGIAVETISADLSQRQSQERIAARLEASDEPIDILVNNAGFSVRAKLVDRDISEHDRGFEVMQRAVLKLGGAAARTMAREPGSVKQRLPSGWIINVCSVSGLITQNNYTAIKAWTLNYSESLGVEIAGSGVQVTALVPGWVRTEFHERAGIRGSSIPDILWIDADELVEHCLRDVARGKTVSTPLIRWKVIATGLRLLPRGAVHRISGLLSSRRKHEG